LKIYFETKLYSYLSVKKIKLVTFKILRYILQVFAHKRNFYNL